MRGKTKKRAELGVGGCVSSFFPLSLSDHHHPWLSSTGKPGMQLTRRALLPLQTDWQKKKKDQQILQESSMEVVRGETSFSFLKTFNRLSGS